MKLHCIALHCAITGRPAQDKGQTGGDGPTWNLNQHLTKSPSPLEDVENLQDFTKGSLGFFLDCTWKGNPSLMHPMGQFLTHKPLKELVAKKLSLAQNVIFIEFVDLSWLRICHGERCTRGQGRGEKWRCAKEEASITMPRRQLVCVLAASALIQCRGNPVYNTHYALILCWGEVPPPG